MNGHHVSKYLKEKMPGVLEKKFEQDHNFNRPEKISDFYHKIPQLLNDTFI